MDLAEIFFSYVVEDAKFLMIRLVIECFGIHLLPKKSQLSPLNPRIKEINIFNWSDSKYCPLIENSLGF